MQAWQMVALLGFVIMVYAWLFMKKQEPADHASMLVDVERTLEQFATEVEASNEKVIEQLALLKREQMEQKARWEQRLDVLEQRTHHWLQQGEANVPQATGKSAAPGIQERYGQLIELKSQGLTTQEIAKQTGMNHGEVLLILQLAVQEDGERE